MPSPAVKQPPPKAPPARKFPVPYGLFIVLAVYALCVYGYIWTNYWNSPEYKAALGYAKALMILGVDDGRKCSEAQLTEAFEATLEAARLMPDERQLVDHLESLRHRFAERKFKLKPELVKKVEMMSANTMRIEQERKAWLVVGQRDRGWAPDQLLAGPERVVLWSIPGGVLIIAFWAYTRFSGKAARDKDHEADLKQAEREVEELGDFRRGLGSRPPPKVEDDADTLAASPPVRAKPPSKGGYVSPSSPNLKPTRPRTSSGVKPVKRRPPEDD
ncbi:MAG: hypothetical protein Q8L48_25700 [Archangium sp.]|nr:hypothetical protein [Archangium sp.]